MVIIFVSKETARGGGVVVYTYKQTARVVVHTCNASAQEVKVRRLEDCCESEISRGCQNKIKNTKKKMRTQLCSFHEYSKILSSK